MDSGAALAAEVRLAGVTSFSGSLTGEYKYEREEGSAVPARTESGLAESLRLGLSGFLLTERLAQFRLDGYLKAGEAEVREHNLGATLYLFNRHPVGLELGGSQSRQEVEVEGGPDYLRERREVTVGLGLRMLEFPARLRLTSAEVKSTGSATEDASYLTGEFALTQRLGREVLADFFYRYLDRDDRLEAAGDQRYHEAVLNAGGSFLYDLVRWDSRFSAWRWEQPNPTSRVSLSEQLSIDHSARTSSSYQYDLLVQDFPLPSGVARSTGHRLGAGVTHRLDPRFTLRGRTSLDLQDAYQLKRRALGAGAGVAYQEAVRGYDLQASYDLGYSAWEQEGRYAWVVKEPHTVPENPPLEVRLGQPRVVESSVRVWVKEETGWVEKTAYTRVEIRIEADGLPWAYVVVVDESELPGGVEIYVDYEYESPQEGRWTALSHHLGAGVARQIRPDLAASLRLDGHQEQGQGETAGGPATTQTGYAQATLAAEYTPFPWRARGELTLYDQGTRLSATASGVVYDTPVNGWLQWNFYKVGENNQSFYSGVEARRSVLEGLNLSGRASLYQATNAGQVTTSYQELQGEAGYVFWRSLQLRGSVKLRLEQEPVDKTSLVLGTGVDFFRGSTRLQLSLEHEGWEKRGFAYDNPNVPVREYYAEDRITLSFSRTF